MRLDTKQALRPVSCLPNPSAMQGARWERRGFAAHAPCRLKPSAMREVEQAEPCIKQRRSPFGGHLQTFSAHNPRQR